MQNAIYDSLVECEFFNERERCEAMKAYRTLLHSDVLETFMSCINVLYNALYFMTFLDFIEHAAHRMHSLVSEEAIGYHNTNHRKAQR